MGIYGAKAALKIKTQNWKKVQRAKRDRKRARTYPYIAIESEKEPALESHDELSIKQETPSL